jgi:hypothetical protein
MATVLAIPATVPLPPAGEVLSPEHSPVTEYHEELIRASHALRRSLMRIAYYGFRIRLSEGWAMLGFEPGPRGEEAYRESLGIPRSTWYKYLRIGQGLHQLSLEDLERIPVSNAELLIQVNPALTHEFPWVHEAKTKTPAQLAQLVADRNKAAGDDREPLSTMVLKVPILAKRAMEDMLESFQHKHELSSKGQALELLIADLHRDANLLAAVHQARQLLDGVQRSRAVRSAPESEESTWLAMAKEVLDAGYEEAIQASRAKSNGSQKGGGS